MYLVFNDEYQIVWKDGIIDIIGTRGEISGRVSELENEGYTLNEDFYITKYID